MTAKRADRKTEDGEQDSGQTFEKALERLENIVAEMEAGSLGLEDMITRFEEGQKLIKFCSGKLNEVERKIEILVKKGDAITTEPFGEGDEGDDEGTGKDGKVP